MNKSIIACACLCMLVITGCHKNENKVQKWAKTFGGANSDYGFSVQQTSDKGYIITGYTYSYGAGGSDVYLIKTDTYGDTVWMKTFGGNGNDAGNSVHQTVDGGYVITGQTTSYGAGDHVYLIKTDAYGDTVWAKTFGGNEVDCGRSVQQTSDGNYIIVGYTSSFGAGEFDIYFIKTEANGNLIWTKTFGGTNSDCGYSVEQTLDGGYIITGYTYSYGAGGSDVYLIKADENGDTVWTKTFGGNDNDYGFSIQQAIDGGYIIVGRTSSYGAGYDDVYLIKTDMNGNQSWVKTFGGSSPDGGNSVQQTSDGGFIICGYTNSFGAVGSDVYLIKTDENGNTIWAKTFGGDSSADVGLAVRQTVDGGYIITGSTFSFSTAHSDVYLIKTDENGNTE
jgi:hypothetical protein